MIVAGVSVIGGDYGEQRRIAREPNSVIRSAISTMCVPRRQRRIEPRSRRALEIELINGSKEDTMVPGITETECRIAQSRYRELHVEASRQRRSAQVAPMQTSRVGLIETMHRGIRVLHERASGILRVVSTQEGTEHAATPGALAASK